MGKLRDFASIVAVLSDREIDEMQAAIDARREARARSGGAHAAASRPRPEETAGPAREAP